MAASKHQILISELVHKIATKFQRLVVYTHVLRSTYLVGIIAMLSDQTGRNRKWKIQDCKREIIISYLVR